MEGRLKVFLENDPSTVLVDKKNVITGISPFLFARLLASSTEPRYGVWGIALGTGDSSWPQNTQPDATADQTALVTQVLRKQLSSAVFIDGTGAQMAGGQFSNTVRFQTVINATTDGITGVAIREQGLIGGGTTNTNAGGPTDMLTAPYWDPNSPAANTVMLLNYLTIPPLFAPPGLNIVFQWDVQF